MNLRHQETENFKNYNIMPNRNFLVLCNIQNMFKIKQQCIANLIQKKYNFLKEKIATTACQ